MKTILVPLDLSLGSRRVCDTACEIAKPSRARLVLLHVVTPPPVNLASHGFAYRQISGMQATLERRAARSLLAFGRRCSTRLGRDVRTVDRTGEAVPTILAKAAEIGADLILLGSHGHTAAYDLLVGSTAQAILRRSRVPVLVVPMNPA